MYTPAKKKVKSFVWKHFKITDCGKKAICNHCHREIAYTLSSMSNLGRHIKNKHPDMKMDVTVNNSPIVIYRMQETEEVGTEDVAQLKKCEIRVKDFEIMDQDNNESQSEPPDPDWTPENVEDWKSEHSLVADGSTRQKKERKVTRRSAMWDHFEKSACKTNGVCVHCGKVIRLGTISNLARHMRNKHPTIPINVPKFDNFTKEKADIVHEEDEQDVLKSETGVCTEVIEINVNDFENPINIIETRTDENINMQLAMSDEENYINITKGSQTEFINENEEFNVYDYIKPKTTGVIAEQVDRQLVKMLMKGCHHVNMVEQETFKDFVRLLNPKYVMPSTNKIIGELIPYLYRECEKKTYKSLQDAEGICLYIDQWKSKTNNYVCATAHFINTECKFEALFLSCNVLSLTESASNISVQLNETATEWGITEKIVAVVTDNTNLLNAVTLCNWPHIPHFTKCLCLAVHECLQSIKTLVCKVKNIVEKLTDMPEAIAEIYSVQKSLKLPQVKLITKVKSDWRSSFLTLEMLTRFVKLKTAICQIQQKPMGLKLTENEWKILIGVVEILSVFKMVKKEVLEQDTVTFSKVVFYIRTLKKIMKTYQITNTMPSDVTYIATLAETVLIEQFKDLEEVDWITKVVLLDPRLKKYMFDDTSEYADACSKLKKEVCEVIMPETIYCEPKPNSFWHHFDEEVKKLNAVKDPIGKGILELENYLQEQLLNRNEDPLVWWNERRAIYPRLFKLAKKYLCVTARSSTRESISLKSANMLSRLKYSESSPSEAEVMLLHHNM